MIDQRAKIAALSFVATSEDGEQLKIWENVTDGRAAADACIEFIAAGEAPCFLGHVARAQRGVFGPAEIAFWHRIAERAVFA